MSKYDHANEEKSSNDLYIRENEQGDLQATDLSTGEVIQVTGDSLPLPAKYTVEGGEMVCHLIRSGCTVAKAARLANLPHENSIYSWMRKSEDFKLKYQEAKNDRAHKFRDNIQEIAEKPVLSRDEIAGYKFKTDLYEKLAGWDNKEEYGTKHVASTHSGALQLIITTGIDRSKPDEPEPIIIQSEQDKDKKGHASSEGE